MTQETRKLPKESRLTNTSKDLIVLAVATIFIFLFSYFFNVFRFLVEIFQKYPSAVVWIDEIITTLVTLSIGFSIFSLRRWRELKKETAQRISLQEELLKAAETKAQVESIICRQLHCEIDEYKKVEKFVLSGRAKTKK